ncbi:MAG: hypothetical protein EOP84_15525 [Verrucomicrobiaceae bacterium]|nr:MAG: hypothetical protein EOP84_15525 [Verrucomicrobiaceae bacterium]
MAGAGGLLGWCFFEQYYAHAVEAGVLFGGCIGWVIHQVAESLSVESELDKVAQPTAKPLTAAQQLRAFFRPVPERSNSTPATRSRITQKLTPISTPRRPKVSASPERQRSLWD